MCLIEHQCYVGHCPPDAHAGIIRWRWPRATLLSGDRTHNVIRFLELFLRCTGTAYQTAA